MTTGLAAFGAFLAAIDASLATIASAVLAAALLLFLVGRRLKPDGGSVSPLSRIGVVLVGVGLFVVSVVSTQPRSVVDTLPWAVLSAYAAWSLWTGLRR